MSYLEICPWAHNQIILHIRKWNGKEYAIVGSFEIRCAEDQLEIMTEQNWKTNHRNDMQVSHYVNKPTFHKEVLEPFEYKSVYLKEVTSSSESGEKQK